MPRLYICILLLPLAACGSNSHAAGDSDANPDTALETSAPDSNKLLPPHQEMFDSVLAHLLTSCDCVDGNWGEDFGDASFYAISFLVEEGLLRDDPQLLLKGLSTARFAVQLIDDWQADPTLFFETVDDLLMGYFGLMDLYRNYDEVQALVETVQPGALEGLEKETLAEKLSYAVDGLNSLITLFGSYVPDMEGIYSIETYGNTTVTALFALANVEFASTFGVAQSAHLMQQAHDLIDVIHETAWDKALGAYRYRPQVEKLYLYPNITMMLLYGRFNALDGTPEYLARAETLFQAIQALKDQQQGAYHSPYSMEFMGAKTDDYKTLSSQNYAALAFMTLYESTGAAELLSEVGQLLSFVEEYLHVDGQVFHHWMDGAMALPEHEEYYCTGCNFQLLYVIQTYWKFMNSR